MPIYDADVIIAGLGPTGDALAGLLALQGVSVIAVEKNPTPFPLPRAAVFDHEIMRIFQMLGVAERIAPVCRVVDRYQFVTAAGELLLDFELNPAHPVSAWAESYGLHQPAVEAILRARLEELGATLRLGVPLTGITQDADSATATLADGTTLRAKYIVGCDGASSPVREALGVGLFDYGFDEPWLVLDTILNEGTLPWQVRQICDPQRPVTYMAMAKPRYRWEFMIKPGENPADMLADEKIRELLAPWDCADRVTIERKAVYRFHALVAHHWRQGRVLLAGDAAHQMPPFAGQGMCAGLRDAANLAWKLTAAVQDNVDLLDHYQTEREPHVREIIETAVAMGRVVCILDEQAAAGRNAGMLARKAAGEEDISIGYPPLKAGLLHASPNAGLQFPQFVAENTRLDDALGLHAVLLSPTPAASTPRLRELGLDDPTLAPFAAPLHAWLAEAGAEAVLIRPDRYVFGTGTASALREAWSK
jgi:3-(3-hydroxy-phenyl)propionate hydroxylase